MQPKQPTTYTKTLLKFYEDFVDFQGECAFLFEAITSMTSEEEFLGQETALGISRYAHFLKQKINSLSVELKELYQNAYLIEHSVPDTDRAKQPDKEASSKK